MAVANKFTGIPKHVLPLIVAVGIAFTTWANEVVEIAGVAHALLVVISTLIIAPFTGLL